MTFEELIQIMREDFLNDIVKPYIWSDDNLFRNLIQAEVEACRRAKLIIDTSKTIDLSAGVSSYSLPIGILTIDSARVEGKPVSQITQPEFEYYYNDAVNLPDGFPKFFMIPNNTTIEVVPVPKEDYTMKLIVSRLPITNRTYIDEPEIPGYTHYHLIYGALATCYAKQDTDTYNNKKAAEFDALFSKQFGDPISARTEMRKKRYPPDMRIRGAAKKKGFI